MSERDRYRSARVSLRAHLLKGATAFAFLAGGAVAFALRSYERRVEWGRMVC